jgi:membrane protein YqaA with SNARE-associated domain
LLIVFGAVIGDALSKTILYLGGREAERMISPRKAAALARARELLSGHRRLRTTTIVVSGATGVPPFYLVTIACGALEVPLREFLPLCALGRGIRFLVLIGLLRTVAAAVM